MSARNAKPARSEAAQEIVDHFRGAAPEAPPGSGETPLLEEDVGALEYKELTEELLAEYLRVQERAGNLAKIQAMLRAQILKLMGADASAQRGSYVCLLKERTSAVIDWREYVLAEIGPEALQELDEARELVKKDKAGSRYISTTRSKVLEVRRMDNQEKADY